MIRTVLKAALVSAVLLSAPAARAQAEEARAATERPATLRLTFDVGARTGVVSVALFDSAQAFDGGGAPVRAARIDLSADEEPVAVFEGLKPGSYAAKAMHDVDGNGRLNANPFGLPTEPYAFTNNARGQFGPARWDAAVVTVSDTVEQTVVLK